MNKLRIRLALLSCSKKSHYYIAISCYLLISSCAASREAAFANKQALRESIRHEYHDDSLIIIERIK